MTAHLPAAVLADMLIEEAGAAALLAAASRLEALTEDEPMTAARAITWLRDVVDRAHHNDPDAQDILRGTA